MRAESAKVLPSQLSLSIVSLGVARLSAGSRGVGEWSSGSDLCEGAAHWLGILIGAAVYADIQKLHMELAVTETPGSHHLSLLGLATAELECDRKRTLEHPEKILAAHPYPIS